MKASWNFPIMLKTGDRIKIVAPKAKTKVSPSRLTLSGHFITNKTSITETFNTFFCQYCPNRASNI